MSILQTLEFIANHPLNRNHKAQALMGFLKWQIGSRLVPGAVLFDWVGGTRFSVRPGEWALTQSIYCGLMEFEDMAFVLHLLQPGDLFVDIGANVGSYTILACGARGARGVCFEPVPSTFDRLSVNIFLNDLSGRVRPMKIGLSDREGELAFTIGNDTANHVVRAGEAGGAVQKIPVLTLDAVLADESPTFFKMDVEGFETSVLNGAEATLAKPSLLGALIELNGQGPRYGFDEKNIVSRMKDFGFSTYSYDPFSRTLRPLDGKNPSCDNTLFLRNEQAVRDRISQAPRIKVGFGEI
jgi:FkbM family methyltransferase